MTKNKIIKSTLVNIDSTFRNTIPKNIYKTDSTLLPSNPLSFVQGSNEIKIYYPNNTLEIGDSIIIQNVTGVNQILYNSFYLFSQFDYLIINYNNINIPSNYKDYTDGLFVNINIYGDTTVENMINNIPLNSFIGYQQVFLASDITNISTIIAQKITDQFNYTHEQMQNNLLFIKLPANYNITNAYETNIDQTFSVTFTSIAGIDVGYINSNYPVNNYNFQSSQTVSRINSNEPDYIYININSSHTACCTIMGGGNSVQIMKILDSIEGYPYSNNYTIQLKKTFNNVISIELLSTEFPYIDLLVQKNVNNKLYWQNLEDGLNIYSISIDEGSYKLSSLITTLTDAMNSTLRIISTNEMPVYNIFTINHINDIQKITFSAYNDVSLPESLSVTKVLINKQYFYLLKINDENNTVKINDIITISGASYTSIFGTNVYIDGKYINKQYNVYSVDSLAQSYSVIIGSIDQIETIANSNNTVYYGGANIKVLEATQFKLLFNYPDTLGNILGFKNTGNSSSIFGFQSTITNFDNYINNNDLNSIGDIDNTNNLMNFSGSYNYVLMYLNDIEFIYSTNLPSAFAKIQLNGNQGDYLFNTFVNQPNDLYSQSFPIITLSELSVSFLYPDGTIPDFRNINHSFTLRIVEEVIQSSETRLNSNHLTFGNELLKSNNINSS